MIQSLQLPSTGLLNEASYPDRTLIYRERVDGLGSPDLCDSHLC